MMTQINLAPAAERYVERMGLLWEAEGLPRIAGRMLGLLALQSDAASLDDIAAALGVSKASVSADARQLERLALVERVSRPGDRRDYYAIAPDMPARVVSLKLGELQQLQDALADARALPGTDGVVHARLLAFGEFQSRLMTLMRGLLAALECPPAEPAPPSRTTVNQT
jgi:DNA-binding transcriptional ArsR family regulator